MVFPDTFTPQDRKPKVIIVGAGIGGLLLGILLERANIPYDIFERASHVRTLGIYDELAARGKICNCIEMYNDKRKPTRIVDFEAVNEMGGADGFIISRSALYEMLLKQVPAHKLHMGKKILSTVQGDLGVQIRCSDGSFADGDILVGADGAYSGVRQNLYEQLRKEGKLPPNDDKALPYSCVCLLGQSFPMDPGLIPEVNESICHYKNVLAADKSFSWSTFTTHNNIVCWCVVQYLDGESAKLNDSFRNTEWSTEAALAMCEHVWDFPLPGGNGSLKLGDIISNTPTKQISKVMLEEKLFDTWYHRRTVLLGDACHKLHPAGGQGAALAMQDAVVLANWINVLPSNSIGDIENIFKEYKQESYPIAKSAFDHGRMMHLTYAKGFKASITRYWFKNMPERQRKNILAKFVAYRPQVSFLPLVRDVGTVIPGHQPSLEKTLAILRAKEYGQMAQGDFFDSDR
ncbi:hypothetical protein EDD11_006499 [Mortierella claussenii]|nr:hypothetical protein EDD11_006499 [Mortierella claussenii]